MSAVVFTLLSGKLPAGNHQFSTVIFREGDDEAHYYELKYRFHGRYKSSPLFNQVWERMIRPLKSVGEAVTWRTRKVLKRANIVPLEVKYMTTAVIPAEGTKPARTRHITAVKLEANDFFRLERDGMLRLLYRGVATKHDKIRDSLFDLTPLLNRPKRREERS